MKFSFTFKKPIKQENKKWKSSKIPIDFGDN